MEPLFVGLSVLAVGGALGLWRARVRRKSRDRSLALPKMRRFFEEEIPLFARLDAARQASFVERAWDFLGSQRMYYVDQTKSEHPLPLDQVDPRMGWRIAGAAATLSLGVESLRWPTTRDILVYPTAFDDNYDVDSDHKIAGMVHAQGPVIFSATDLVRSYQKEDGYNVAIHELAHVLDMADSYADGSIAGVKGADGTQWSKLVSQRVFAIRGGRYAKLRSYAGTNEAEFFAVAVEAFFEEPGKLQASDGILYEKLVQTFRFDPAELRGV